MVTRASSWTIPRSLRQPAQRLKGSDQTFLSISVNIKWKLPSSHILHFFLLPEHLLCCETLRKMMTEKISFYFKWCPPTSISMMLLEYTMTDSHWVNLLLLHIHCLIRWIKALLALENVLPWTLANYHIFTYIQEASGTLHKYLSVSMVTVFFFHNWKVLQFFNLLKIS